MPPCLCAAHAGRALCVSAAVLLLYCCCRYHMLGQGVFFAVWGGLPYFIWGFVVRVLFTMHMTWSVAALPKWGLRFRVRGWVLPHSVEHHKSAASTSSDAMLNRVFLCTAMGLSHMLTWVLAVRYLAKTCLYYSSCCFQRWFHIVKNRSPSSACGPQPCSCCLLQLHCSSCCVLLLENAPVTAATSAAAAAAAGW